MIFIGRHRFQKAKQGYLQYLYRRRQRRGRRRRGRRGRDCAASTTCKSSSLFFTSWEDATPPMPSHVKPVSHCGRGHLVSRHLGSSLGSNLLRRPPLSISHHSSSCLDSIYNRHYKYVVLVSNVLRNDNCRGTPR